MNLVRGATTALVIAIGIAAATPAAAEDSTDGVVVGHLLVVEHDEVSGPPSADTPAPAPEPADVSVVTDDGRQVPVDPAVLDHAGPGDLVRVELASPPVADTPAEVQDVDVLATAAASSPAGAHTVAVVLMTPPGYAAVPAAQTQVTASIGQASAFWSAQSGSTVSFAVGPVATAWGGLTDCAPDTAWKEASAVLGWSTSTSGYWPEYPVNHLVVVVPDGCGSQGLGTVGPGYGGNGDVYLSDSSTTPQGNLNGDVVAHELGHNLTLMHAGMLYCPQQPWDGDARGIVDPPGCASDEYGDVFDVMGYSGLTNMGSLSAPAAVRLGFMNLGTNVATVGPAAGTTTVTLNAVSTHTGIQAARVTDPVSGESYWVELRADNGYDTQRDQLHGQPFGLCFVTPCGSPYPVVTASFGVRIVKVRPDLETVVLAVRSSASAVAPDSSALPAGSVFLSKTGALAVSVDSVTGTTARVTITTAAGSAFNDVGLDNQFYDEIAWLASTGVTGGYADGGFHPTAAVSRQAMAAFLYRFAGSPAFTPPASSPFNDVPTNDQFYAAVTWLADVGVTTGYADGGFHPTAAVSRQAMAAFLYRFAGEPAFAPPGSSPFNDVTGDNQFFADITWLASTGVTGGYADGGFHPTAAVSRQAMAAFLYRFGLGTDGA